MIRLTPLVPGAEACNAVVGGTWVMIVKFGGIPGVASFAATLG